MNWPSNLFCLVISSVLFTVCTSTDLITRESSIRDGDVLISSGGDFVLGFFSPGNSSRRYLGIWYNKIPEKTVVWVANRDNPLTNSSGLLTIDNLGNLLLYDTKRNISVWGSNLPLSSVVSDRIAQLCDSGNLVLFQDGKKSSVLWQSFDHPTDTLLPSMKLSLNRTSGLNRFITAWKSQDDPGAGTTYFMINPKGVPHLALYKNQVLLWRMTTWIGANPWIGAILNGVSALTQYSWSNVTFIIDANEVYVLPRFLNSSIFARFVVRESGIVQLSAWAKNQNEWVSASTEPLQQCDSYGHCGANGNCLSDIKCECLPGFTPKSPINWRMRDSSGGCIRKNQESVCRNGEGFVKVAEVKLPDTSLAYYDMNRTLRECKSECLRKCSCTAYAAEDSEKGGSGCYMWYGDLMDTRVIPFGGRDLQVRVDALVLGNPRKQNSI